MTTGPEDGGADALGTLMTDFQSLGDNCEFGLVQRYVGVEPLGLFRFNNAELMQLIEALDSDFRHYGEPGDLDIFVGFFDYLSCHSRRHGFTYSTGETAGTIEPQAQLQREYRKLAYLKRRLMEDLASGEQILLRKGPSGESLDDVMPLARAVRRHGPSTILRVRRAESGEEPGSVRWVADGVMEGVVRRFSPYEGGMDIDLEPWIALCRNAHWLSRGHPGQPPPLRIASATVQYADRAQQHRTAAPAQASEPDRARPGLLTRTLGIRSDRIAPGSVVFSAWIWLPEAFEGERLSAVLGSYGLAWRDADLSLREAWQRVWVLARVSPRHGRLRAGFGSTGPGGQHFWSTGWRLSEGPLPVAEAPPSIVVTDAGGGRGSRLGEGLGRWLSGLTR